MNGKCCSDIEIALSEAEAVELEHTALLGQMIIENSKNDSIREALFTLAYHPLQKEKVIFRCTKGIINFFAGAGYYSLIMENGEAEAEISNSKKGKRLKTYIENFRKY
jgi:hypothetical protein